MIQHGGGIIGFTSANGYFPDDSLSVTVFTNSGSFGPDLYSKTSRVQRWDFLVGVSAPKP